MISYEKRTVTSAIAVETKKQHLWVISGKILGIILGFFFFFLFVLFLAPVSTSWTFLLSLRGTSKREREVVIDAFGFEGFGIRRLTAL